MLTSTDASSRQSSQPGTIILRIRHPNHLGQLQAIHKNFRIPIAIRTRHHQPTPDGFHHG
ncbi:hypothetical protein PYCC9005_004880 [Savitreella phatthalungensis]